MDEEMMKILSEFDQVDDNSFPDFVLNPRLGEFTDPSIMRLYLKEFKRSDDPRLKIIKTGRNRESNYGRYQYKLSVWEDYIEELADTYYPGFPVEYSVPLILQSADEGLIDEEVPNKPRMKNSKKNRLQKKLGFDPMDGVEVDAREVDSLVRSAEENETDVDTGVQVVYSEEENARLDKAAKQVMMKSRLNKFVNASTAFGSRNDVSLMAEYLNNDTGNIKRDEQSAFDMLRKEEELELVPEYILRKNERVRGGRLSMNGLTVRDSQEEEQVDLYRSLMNSGFNAAEIDALTNGGANLTKKQLRIISSEIGEESLAKMEKFQKMSKKERKKQKKREAREASRYSNASGSISSLMSMNKHNLGKFGSGSPLASLARSIYGDDDD